MHWPRLLLESALSTVLIPIKMVLFATYAMPKIYQMCLIKAAANKKC